MTLIHIGKGSYLFDGMYCGVDELQDNLHWVNPALIIPLVLKPCLCDVCVMLCFAEGRTLLWETKS